jgi:hypothetical protein
MATPDRHPSPHHSILSDVRGGIFGRNRRRCQCGNSVKRHVLKTWCSLAVLGRCPVHAGCLTYFGGYHCMNRGNLNGDPPRVSRLDSGPTYQTISTSCVLVPCSRPRSTLLRPRSTLPSSVNLRIAQTSVLWEPRWSQGGSHEQEVERAALGRAARSIRKTADRSPLYGPSDLPGLAEPRYGV